MPAIVRFGDADSDGSPATSGSPNVFVNNKSVVRIGDRFADSAVQTTGSPNVFANGIPIARIGDIVSDTIPDPLPTDYDMEGSPNGFCKRRLIYSCRRLMSATTQALSPPFGLTT